MPRTLLRYTRLIHLYLGVFITPALIFFAFTGALQTFSLHETTRGSSYVPPRWAVVLGQIHKKQTAIVPVRRPQPPPAGTDRSTSPDRSAGHDKNTAANRPADIPGPPPPSRHSLPLKIFFLIVAIGLFTSSLTGLYMAYQYAGNKTLITALLVIGTVLPILLVFV